MDHKLNTVIAREYIEKKIIKVETVQNLLLILCENGKIYLSFFKDYVNFCREE